MIIELHKTILSFYWKLIQLLDSAKQQNLVLLPINIKHHMNHLSIFILNASCDVYINHENKLKANDHKECWNNIVYIDSRIFSKQTHQVNI